VGFRVKNLDKTIFITVTYNFSLIKKLIFFFGKTAQTKNTNKEHKQRTQTKNTNKEHKQRTQTWLP